MSDNFGDHKNTGNSRVDGDLRAPLDMGKGSKKLNYFHCPKCNALLQARVTCRGMSCGVCQHWFDPKEANPYTGESVDGEKSHAPHVPKVSKEYMAFRKRSEQQAESYARGSKKKFFG